MNKQRRKDLLAVLKAVAQASEDLDQITSEEQEAYDNLPDGIQAGAKGEALQENIDLLEQAVGELSDIDSTLGELT
ncbi:hypothetical protein IIA15_00345 [candidate division TA06 bacterium]|nr:hypothetical protein [candidate division TA06 bacterium]